VTHERKHGVLSSFHHVQVVLRKTTLFRSYFSSRSNVENCRGWHGIYTQSSLQHTSTVAVRYGTCRFCAGTHMQQVETVHVCPLEDHTAVARKDAHLCPISARIFVSTSYTAKQCKFCMFHILNAHPVRDVFLGSIDIPAPHDWHVRRTCPLRR
jgi:hypothetical protein